MGSLMHVLPSLFIPPKHIHLKRELAPAVQEVCRCLDVDLTGQTSASFNMRQNYERCLFQFEDYLASGAYVADVNAGRAPSAEAIAPFVCRHSIAQLPAPGEIGAPRRIPPPEREPSEPKERLPPGRGESSPRHCPVITCRPSGASTMYAGAHALCGEGGPGTIAIRRNMPGYATAASKDCCCCCAEQDRVLKVLRYPQREAGGGGSTGSWMAVMQRMLTIMMTKRTSSSRTSPPNRPGARYSPLSPSHLIWF